MQERSTVEDSPVEEGDMVKFDFDGSVDGVPFDGGKAENYDLTIGSGSFIPGFEDQLVAARMRRRSRSKGNLPGRLPGKRAGRKRCSIQMYSDMRSRKSSFRRSMMISHRRFPNSILWMSTRRQFRQDERHRRTEAKSAKEDEAVQKAVANAQWKFRSQ